MSKNQYCGIYFWDLYVSIVFQRLISPINVKITTLTIPLNKILTEGYENKKYK